MSSKWSGKFGDKPSGEESSEYQDYLYAAELREWQAEQERLEWQAVLGITLEAIGTSYAAPVSALTR